MFKMDSRNYSIICSILSLPFRKGERIFIPLEFGEYQRSFLMDTALKRGTVTITESSIVIAFSKENTTMNPSKSVGYDLNEKSIVGSDGARYDLTEVARLHTLYGVKRSSFFERHPHGKRIRKKFASSRREKARVGEVLHRVSSQILERAKTNNNAIVLERLSGIRYAHQKGNGESKQQRRRIAMWPFRQLQSCIDYKAKWAGVFVEYVSPSYTSKTCHACGTINRELKLTDRSWLCPQCGATLDRDLNAAINIERRGKIRCLGEVRPGARDKNEAMKGNETMVEALIPQAEIPKSSL